MMTDPIADMLTRIRNANVKVELARILRDEGYIQGYTKVEDDKQGILRLQLRRAADGSGVILGIERVSRPGCRIYVGKDDIPKVQGGLGINVLSTSRGVMTGREAARVGVGGESLCNVW
jgi:small subunit ribosomal protein S8